ncbi:hypothetical protein CROQUDRAFT_93126 [Cronartium quercuum f. sp. fusiforme G11]|uniref:AMP-dependent synthetase/ligase domain-containing protein n=1 Tax=Cronartium quercuum f. sp. fusiforme G11 TaxID=708437 RepID=A0A9P6TBX1_9BASI|nr:hypothetical protein CROQUDRAFT_93126 [Cronartium quercuum f. sp. fusiforme G11]
MTSTYCIYPSLFGSLPSMSDEHNAWDFLVSKLSPESLSSTEPFNVDVQSGLTRSLSEVITRAEHLARYLCVLMTSVPESNARQVGTSEGCLRSVGLLSPNHLDYPLVIYACLAAGVPVAPITSTASSIEARYLSQLGQCAIIFVHPKCLPTIQKAGYPIEQIILIEATTDWHGPTLEGFIKMGTMSPQITLGGLHPVPAHRVALILFSSGSTGNPKAVMLTHRNICSALQGALLVKDFAQEVMLKKSPTLALKPQARLVALVFLPSEFLFNIPPHLCCELKSYVHAYGLMIGVLRSMLYNACTCIMPKWDFSQALKAIPKYKVTMLGLVPAIATQILAHSHLLNDADLSSITSIAVGAAAITSSQKHELLKLLAARGAMGGISDESSMSNGYGMSETTVSITTWPLEGYPCGPARPGTIGVLLPTFEARVIREDSVSPSGEDAPVNTAGELWLRGPSIMKGYLNNDLETQAALTPDGWFKTGDKIRIEADGQMFYIDRLKDTFKNRGLQVAPSEIASLILKHLPEMIADAVVIGMPSQGSRDIGEEAWAFIVLTPAGRDSNQPEKICEQVRSISREKLSMHKWVSRVVIMPEFPKGPTHKVLVREIRAQALRDLKQGESRLKL